MLPLLQTCHVSNSSGAAVAPRLTGSLCVTSAVTEESRHRQPACVFSDFHHMGSGTPGCETQPKVDTVLSLLLLPLSPSAELSWIDPKKLTMMSYSGFALIFDRTDSAPFGPRRHFPTVRHRAGTSFRLQVESLIILIFIRCNRTYRGANCGSIMRRPVRALLCLAVLLVAGVAEGANLRAGEIRYGFITYHFHSRTVIDWVGGRSGQWHVRRPRHRQLYSSNKS